MNPIGRVDFRIEREVEGGALTIGFICQKCDCRIGVLRWESKPGREAAAAEIDTILTEVEAKEPDRGSAAVAVVEVLLGFDTKTGRLIATALATMARHDLGTHYRDRFSLN